jgi:integrase
MNAKKFPVTITEMGVSARIRKTAKVGDGKKLDYFIIEYVHMGRRKQVWRSDYGKAVAVARDACIKVANGEQEALELKNGDRMIYLRATEYLAPLGIELDVAAREYASVLPTLPEGATLKDAVDCLRRHRSVTLEKRTVQQVVDEMIVMKRAANLSAVHLDDLEGRLNRFADDFQMNIGDVKGKQIQAWLDAMKRSGRTKYNYLRCISTLFRFAIRRKYLTKDALDEIEAVDRSKQDTDGPIEIYTPGELKLLLNKAGKRLVPFIAVGAFAGLRSSEILRLDWQDVKLDSDCIVVQKGKVKKRGKSRRIVPMLPNLKAWLQPIAKSAGSIWPFSKPYLYESLAGVATKAEVPWKSNALRHSFVSYRVAGIKNVPQVALECGNSPQIIDSNYRELVTEQDAEKWFSILPPRRAAKRKLVVT